MHPKDNIAASFHGLIPVRANLEYGTSGIVSSHGLIGSVSEARV